MITNIGKAHLEGFGGIEGVKTGKGELYDYLAKSGSEKFRGVAFINAGNPILLKMQHDRGLTNAIYYGSAGNNNKVTGQLAQSSPYLTFRWINKDSAKNHLVKTELTGAYNLDNILAAICIGVYFKLTDDEINKGIEDYQPKNNRSQILKTTTNTLICDYYNANPSSMFAAIENLGTFDAARKVLILGDMFEMGDESMEEHKAVIQKATVTPVGRV